MTKHEIICITRSGFNFLHTEGGDFAAKVTLLQYEPGQVYDPRNGILQELLIPRQLTEVNANLEILFAARG